MPSHYLNKCWLNTNWAPGFIFEWNCDQSNLKKTTNIAKVVCKTEAILTRSQYVNNNDVAHSSHSGLNINDGGLWTEAISLQFAESVPVVCYEYLWQVPVPCWSQIISSVRGRQHSTFDYSWTRSYLRGAWEKFAGNGTISIINLSYMCAHSAILWLNIINNKSIEALQLSKIPRDIWARVTPSEIIPRTDFRRGDVVQRSPIKSILPRILGISDTYRWMVEPLRIHICIYFFLGRGKEITGKTLFFSHFFNFPLSTLLKDVCILLLMKPTFYFWTYFLFKHLFGFP